MQYRISRRVAAALFLLVMLGLAWEPGGAVAQGRSDLAIKEKHRFVRPRSVVALAFTPDGREICEQEYTGQGSQMTYTAFNLATGEQRRDDPPLRFQEFVANRKVPVLPKNAVLMPFLPDAEHYLTGKGSLQLEYCVQVRDARDGAVLREFHRHRPVLGFYVLSADGKMLASAQNGSLINVSDVESGKDIVALKGGHDKNVTAMSFHPTQCQIATIGGDYIQIWDMRTAKTVRKLEFASALRVSHTVRTENGSPLRLTSPFRLKKRARLSFSTPTPLRRSSRSMHQRDCGGAGIVFNPAGTLISAGPRGNVVQIWEISEKAEARPPDRKDRGK